MKTPSQMRIRILQHTAATPPGTVTEWLDAKGLAYAIDHLHKGDPLPKLDDFDWVISLGGEMNCDEDEAYPFLREEKALLKAAIERKKTVLGICLGGQLVARALGAEVRKHDSWEVGWHPIQILQSARIVAFQWHQDTFDLPPGATRIATNHVCANQGFIYGDSAVGLQFHPEATEAWIRESVEDANYPTGAHVQTKDHILDEFGFLTPVRKWFFSLLDQMERVTKAAVAAG